MKTPMENDKAIPQWLAWAREIQALAQTGAHYAQNDYELERHTRLRQIAAEIIAQHTSLTAPELEVEFSRQTGYATPRVDVRVAVFRDNRLLMVHETIDGTWAMPGGWADVGDVPSKAAERETLEEAGFKVKATKVIGVYDANRLPELNLYHAYKLLFLCDLLEGQAYTSYETSEVSFFARPDIPVDLLGMRTTTRQIDDAFAALKDPDIQTVFD
jgi:ADP-ribose pyrophosphatase YjhB (NUDIX family)